MATHPKSALPSFSDVLHDFGFQLATVREPRMTQAHLAEAVNKVANKALLEAEFVYEEQKDALEEKLKDAKAALADSQSVGNVDGKLVKDWERGRKFPTDAQYKHIKLAFKELAPLTQAEEEKLDAAYDRGRSIAKQNKNTEAFGEVFDEILSKRMIEMKPPQIASHNDFADMIMLVVDDKEAERLRADTETIKKELEALKPVAPKNYFLVDGDGKKMSLIDGKGNLALSGEHLRMIEHGIVPSGDLLEVIKDAMGNVRMLAREEVSDLDRKYGSLVSDATEHFRALKQRGVLKEDPFEGTTASMPLPNITVTPELVPNETVTAPVTSTVPAVLPTLDEPPVVDGGIVTSLTPSAQLPVVTSTITGPAFRSPPKPKPADEIQSIEISTGQRSHAAQLAETYAAIFAAFGYEPPSVTDESTSRTDNSGGKRAELARTIGLRTASSIPELRPFSLKPLKPETINALVGRASDPRAMKELTDKYNALVDTIRTDIDLSEAGRELADSLNALKSSLSRGKGHTFDDIKYMDSKTGISPANFDDYFTHGGLHMREAADMQDVLEAVNAHWKTGNGGRNILKHDEESWKGEARQYIAAHRQVRAEYETLSRAFESAMSNQLDNVRHNAALNEQAREFALLDARQQLHMQYPGDEDLRLGHIDTQRHRELQQRFRDEPEFARAVAKARENHSFMDDARERKRAATGTGTPG